MGIKKLLGKRIQEIRNSKILTQDKLSEMIDIDRKSLSNIETGRAYPTAENLDKIMSALEVEPSDLFNLEYLKPTEELITEMAQEMSKNEELTRLMYKFFKTVK